MHAISPARCVCTLGLCVSKQQITCRYKCCGIGCESLHPLSHSFAWRNSLSRIFPRRHSCAFMLLSSEEVKVFSRFFSRRQISRPHFWLPIHSGPVTMGGRVKYFGVHFQGQPIETPNRSRRQSLHVFTEFLYKQTALGRVNPSLHLSAAAVTLSSLAVPRKVEAQATFSPAPDRFTTPLNRKGWPTLLFFCLGVGRWVGGWVTWLSKAVCLLC